MSSITQLPLPPTPRGSTEDKFEQTYRYLYRLVTELNRLLQQQNEGK